MLLLLVFVNSAVLESLIIRNPNENAQTVGNIDIK